MDTAPRADATPTAVLGDVPGARVAARHVSTSAGADLPGVPTAVGRGPWPVPTIGEPALGQPIVLAGDRTADAATPATPASTEATISPYQLWYLEVNAANCGCAPPTA